VYCFCTVLIFFLYGCDKSAQQNGRSSQTSAEQIPSDSTLVSNTTALASIKDLAFTDPLSRSQSIPPKIVFSEGGHSVAYLSEKDGTYRVVFNGAVGKPYQTVSHLELSPDGKHIAQDALMDGKRRMVIDGREEMLFDDVWQPVFSPNGRHVAYIAQKGEKSYMVVDGRVSDEGYFSFNGNPVFNATSERVAYMVSAYGDHKAQLIITDLGLNRQAIRECHDEELILSADKRRIACVEGIGNKRRVIDIDFAQPGLVKEGPLFDTVEKPSFGSDGVSIAYAAGRDGVRYLVLNGREEPLPKGELREPPVVRPDGKAAGVLLVMEKGTFFHEAFSKGLKEIMYDEAALLVYSRDGSRHAYCARRGKNTFVVANGKEGPSFDIVIDPMFSPDGRFLVYRARKAGKRFVVVADSTGNVIRHHTSYEMVFNTQFTADGAAIAYGVKDGDSLIWKVEHLSLPLPGKGVE
jgi:Tol biopolymer transport system component